MIVKQSAANKWGCAAGHRLLHALGFFNPYFAAGTSAALRASLYRDWIVGSDDPRAVEQRRRLPRLRGRILVCRCDQSQPCFCEVLHDLANRDV